MKLCFAEYCFSDEFKIALCAANLAAATLTFVWLGLMIVVVMYYNRFWIVIIALIAVVVVVIAVVVVSRVRFTIFGIVGIQLIGTVINFCMLVCRIHNSNILSKSFGFV